MRGGAVSFGLVLSLVLRPERASSLLPSARRRHPGHCRQRPPWDAPPRHRPAPRDGVASPSRWGRQGWSEARPRRRTTGLRSRSLLDEEDLALASADPEVDLGEGGSGPGRTDGGRSTREAIEEAASEEFRPILLLCCAVTFLSALDR